MKENIVFALLNGAIKRERALWQLIILTLLKHFDAIWGWTHDDTCMVCIRDYYYGWTNVFDVVWYPHSVTEPLIYNALSINLTHSMFYYTECKDWAAAWIDGVFIRARTNLECWSWANQEIWSGSQDNIFLLSFSSHGHQSYEQFRDLNGGSSLSILLSPCLFLLEMSEDICWETAFSS